MSDDGKQASERGPRTHWELKFTTRITLIFGLLGFLTLLLSMGYSVQTAKSKFEEDIKQSLLQRQRTIESMVENRINLLDVYLHSITSSRNFMPNSNISENATVESITDDMIFMFQDSVIGASLDIFFLVDHTGDLLFDAGIPLYQIGPILQSIESPILFTNKWTLLENERVSVLLKAVPVFDPASIQLKGYIFAGFAISHNKIFHQDVIARVDLDVLRIGTRESVIFDSAPQINNSKSVRRFLTSDDVLWYDNDVYFIKQDLGLDKITTPIWLELGVAGNRFDSIYIEYWRSFLLLSGGFLLLLFIAGSILHFTHKRAIDNMMNYIGSIKKGMKGVRFTPTGVYEYNQVSEAMQSMVEDLNIAATVFESSEGMLVTDRNQVILRNNQAFSDITGFHSDELIGESLSKLKSEKYTEHFYQEMSKKLLVDGNWQGEIWNQKKNGEEYLQWISITAVMSDATGKVLNYVVTLNDVTQRKAAENKIKQLAFYDQLTQLPNRQLLLDRLRKALLTSARTNTYGALLYLDLDDFKTLNDTRGHDAGDQLLVKTSERLQTCIRRTDTVARIGGDEFIILLEDVGETEKSASNHVDLLCKKILMSLGQPYSIANVEHHSTLSVGVALFVGDTEGIDELLKQADLAMYQAKSAGRNTYRFFNPEMQTKVMEYAEFANDIRSSIQNKDFLLYYQVQVNHHGKLVGTEALLRWMHPVKGMVRPDEFIPIAEETGLIIPLGDWVLEEACQVLAGWAAHTSTQALTLAVNISAHQLRTHDFVEKVKNTISKTGADPRKLKLEITESMLLDDIDDTIEKMRELQAIGITFALDDFGTGYSSLSYLKRLPLDQLKIDKTFVRDLLTDTQDADIASTIVSLAKSLHLSVIAEGVEQEDQRVLLASYGCLLYQGYLFGRPVSLSELMESLLEYENHIS